MFVNEDCVDSRSDVDKGRALDIAPQVDTATADLTIMPPRTSVPWSYTNANQ